MAFPSHRLLRAFTLALAAALALGGYGRLDPALGAASAPRTGRAASAVSGAPLPAGFIGLSLEYKSLAAYTGAEPASIDPVFMQLIRNLALGQAPVLRIGGDSTDEAWWPVAGVAKPPFVSFTLTSAWMQDAAALAHALDAQLILGINLAINPARSYYQPAPGPAKPSRSGRQSHRTRRFVRS